MANPFGPRLRSLLLIKVGRWRLLSRRGARTEVEPRSASDLLERELEWDAVIDAALGDDEIIRAAHSLDIRLSELRSALSREDAIAAIQDVLQDLHALEGRAEGDRREAVLGLAKAALRSHVRKQLHLAIERRTEYAYALNLSVDATTDLANQAFALRAEVIARLRSTCTSMVDGGSVGIVGPSGIGKTRLINHFCGSNAHDNEPRVLSTVVPVGAPCSALDFVKYVAECLCREVLAGSAKEYASSSYGQPPSRWYEQRAKIRWSRFGAVLSCGGASLILIGALGIRPDPLLIAGATCLILAAAISRTGANARASDSALRVTVARLLRRGGGQLPLIGVAMGLIAASQFGTSVDPLVVIGAISLAIASVMRGPPKVLRRLTRSPNSAAGSLAGYPSGLAANARAVLDQLEHNRTIVTAETRLRDGRVGRRVALRLGKSLMISEKFTATAWTTLPDAVRRLSQFVSVDAKDLDIWIGIDLKRMEPERSLSFLEEIDDVLRLKRERCFVLVSVLGDRTCESVLRKRCDHVVALEPLDFADTRGLLGHDGVGLSMPFAALCHVLSGGVPTTVVEHAQALVGSKPTEADGRMSDMARALVTPHLQRHADEVHARALSDANPGSSKVLEWVGDVRTRCASAEALLSHYARRTVLVDSRSQPADLQPGEQPPGRDIERLADGLAAHCYFAATVLAFFDDALSRAAVDNVLNGEPPPLEILRDARSALSINPSHASSLVREFRTRCALEPEGT